jgi:lipopolysaccharide transport system permease protein
MKNVESLQVVTYTTDSQIRTPGLLMRSMFKDIIASNELAQRLFKRDIVAQYRQSLFGILWAFLPSIATSLVFIILQSRNVVNLGETEIPYPVYVLVGTLLWQLFVESLNAPLKSLNTSKPMLGKVNFPHEALITSAFYTILFSAFIKSIILVCVLLLFRVPVTWTILIAPFSVLMLILLGICLGLLISPIGMLYTDVSAALPVVTQLWFFLTPVVYPPPSPSESWFIILNPVTPVLLFSRDLITTGSMAYLTPFSIVSGLTILFLFIGWVIFRVAMPIIVERIGSA